MTPTKLARRLVLSALLRPALFGAYVTVGGCARCPLLVQKNGSPALLGGIWATIFGSSN